MSNLEKFEYLDETLIHRARPYLSKSKMRLIGRDGGRILFKVYGTEAYNVQINLNQFKNQIHVNCTCPYFDQVGDCKHVMAVIMALDHVGEFNTWKDDINIVDDDGPVHESVMNAIVKDQGNELIYFLERNQESPEQPKVVKEKEKPYRECWYQLHVGYHKEVDIEVFYRDRNKNGKMGTFKNKNISLEELDNFSSLEEDTNLLRDALPFLRIDPYSSYGKALKFKYIRLHGPKAKGLIKRFIQTGRLALAESRSHGAVYMDEIIQWKNDLLSYEVKENKDFIKLVFKNEAHEEIELCEYFEFFKEFNLLLNGDEIYEVVPDKHNLIDFFAEKDWKIRITGDKKNFFQKLINMLPGNIFADNFGGFTEKWVTPKYELRLQLPLDQEFVRGKVIHNENITGSAGEIIKIDNTRQEEFYTELRKIEGITLIDDTVTFSISDFEKIIAILDKLGIDVFAEKQKIQTSKTSSFQVSPSGVDWFEIAGGVEFADDLYTLPMILKSAREGSFIKLKNGNLGMIPKKWLDYAAKISDLGDTKNEKIILHKSRAMALEEVAKENYFSGNELVSFVQKISSHRKIEQVSESKLFQGKLRDYQRFSLGWFELLEDVGLGGCLADDMGLGKTVQVLAHLQKRKILTKKKSKILIVCPKSVLGNWQEEAAKFTPNLKTAVYEGRNRKAILSQKDVDLIFINYALIRNDIAELSEMVFDYIILDEAQHIKNASSLIAKSIFALKANHRLALSGTPVENHIGELFSIFNFLIPGVYKKFANVSGKNDKAIKLVAKSLSPFILRRTKKEVLTELPEKTEQNIYCEMSSAQKKHYDELKEYAVKSLTQNLEVDGLSKSKFMILESLTRLRQAACHPGIISKDFQEMEAGKFVVLKGMLEELWSEGHKVVVFSQFTSLLKLCRSYLSLDETNSAYLDGQTKNRDEVIKSFKNKNAIQTFFISIKAGGFGLNLTDANYCFLLDPWWNPAVEAQAIDRIYRMGQKKTVTAYRLIAQGTIEEKILELQKNKKLLTDEILENESVLKNFNMKDFKYLFS
jgi:SNF2 family DNA or RNA helicase